MEQQNLSATVMEKPKVSSADKRLKEAILQQYAEVGLIVRGTLRLAVINMYQ